MGSADDEGGDVGGLTVGGDLEALELDAVETDVHQGGQSGSAGCSSSSTRAATGGGRGDFRPGGFVKEGGDYLVEPGFDGEAQFLFGSGAFFLVASGEFDADEVFGIEREIMHSGDAATRAEWHVHRGPGAFGLDEAGFRRDGLQVADGELGDAARGGQVSFEQGWRHGEKVTHVVEAGAGIVDGKRGAGVDVEREDVANCVAVFDPVEPVRHGRTGIGMQFNCLVESVFEVGDEGGGGCRVSVRGSCGWHLAGTDFTKNAFPVGGLIAGFGGVESL